MTGMLGKILGAKAFAGGLSQDAGGMPGNVMQAIGNQMGMNPEYTASLRELADNRNTPWVHERQQAQMQQPMPMQQQEPAYGYRPMGQGRAPMQMARQSGVKNLVAQRFGAGSPITQYIGSFQYGTPPGGITIPGNPNNIDGVRAVMDVTPGETVTVTPNNYNYINPMLNQGYVDPATRNRGMVYTESGARPAPGLPIRGTDLMRLRRPEATTTDKVFGYLGSIAGRFQGAPPGERIDRAVSFREQRQIQDELDRFNEQLERERRVPNRVEQVVMDQYREKLGQNALFEGLGAQRDMPVAGVDALGRPLSVRQQIGFGPYENISLPVGTGKPRAPQKVYEDTDGDGQADGYRIEKLSADGMRYEVNPNDPLIPIGLNTRESIAAEKAIDNNRELYSAAKEFLSVVADQDDEGNWTLKMTGSVPSVALRMEESEPFMKDLRALERFIRGKDLEMVAGKMPSGPDAEAFYKAKEFLTQITQARGL